MLDPILNVRLGMFFEQPVRADLIVPAVHDASLLRTGENLRDVARSETLFQPHDARQNFLSDDF